MTQRRKDGMWLSQIEKQESALVALEMRSRGATWKQVANRLGYSGNSNSLTKMRELVRYAQEVCESRENSPVFKEIAESIAHA